MTTNSSNPTLAQPQIRAPRLTDRDYHHCVNFRQLNPDWVNASCWTLTKEEATDYLGIPAKSDGIWIQGDGHQGQFRPRKPWRIEKGKKAPKYLTSVNIEASSYDAILPTHPTNPKYWHDLEALKASCYVINDIPCLIITEGGFKAIAGCSHGLPTIGLIGVEMGLTSRKADPQGKRYLIPTLEKLARAGFGFIIAFDADCATKQAIIMAQIKLAHQLKLFNVPVYTITGHWSVEEGKGMDDYIQKNGIDKFREIVATAKEIEKWEEQFKDQTDERGRLPKPDIIGGRLAEDYQNKWLYNGEHKTWMVYELERLGVWTAVDKEYMEVEVDRILEARGIIGYGGDSYINNIIGRLKRKLYTRKWGNNQHLLPFSDCVLNLKTNSVSSHSPENRLTWCLPRPYSLETKATWENINQWLAEATGDNEQHKRQLLCFMAAVLRRRADLQKFLHLIGVGGTGKSTFTNLLVALVGQENCSFVSLDDLNDQHAVADLFGKILYVFADQDKAGRKLTNFKRLTGQDHIRGRLLYQNGFYFMPEGLTVVTSNFPIFHADSGSWLTRRGIMIPFNHKVPEFKKRNLMAEFESELSAFTHYLLGISESEIEATLNGLGKTNLSATLWQSAIRGDALASWLNDCLIQDPTASTQIGSNAQEWAHEAYNPSKSTLFGSYCHHAKQSGRSGLKTKDNFSADLLEMLEQTLGWEVQKVKTKYGRVIKGIRLRTPDDDIPLVEDLIEGDGLSGGPDDDPGGHLKPLSNKNSDEGDDLNQLISDHQESSSATATCCDESESNEKNDETVAVTLPTSQSEQGIPAVTRPDTLDGTQVVTPEAEIDYATFPSRRSNHPEHLRKRANQCKKAMLACGERNSLKAFKANGQFTESEIKWVYHNVLTPSERKQVNQVAAIEQLTLDDIST